jgi:hypothetical protein
MAKNHPIPTHPTEAHVVKMYVLVSMPEHGLAYVNSENGLRYFVTSETKGVALDELNDGDWLECHVSGGGHRVTSARRIRRNFQGRPID